jgi:hypothetical protein
VAERSKARDYGRSLAGIAGLNPTEGMEGCLLGVLCVFSGRGLCDGLITRPEESYRLCCVLVCDLGTSRRRRIKLVKGCKCRIEEEEEVTFITHRDKGRFNIPKDFCLYTPRLLRH